VPDDSVDNDSENPFNLRRYDRGDVRIPCDVREKGFGHHKAMIADLSRSGCKIITPMYLNPEKALFITLPGFSPLEARIARKKNEEYGCEFVNQLHEAIYDHILRTHPSLARRG
jgi:type VI protein secretion system component VasA